MRLTSTPLAAALKRCLLTCAVSWVALSTSPALAEDPAHFAHLEQRWSFDIAAGSLESALLQFSRQTRIQVIVSPKIPEVSVGGVRGNLTAEEALTALLRATGLVYTIVGDTVTIQVPRPGTESDLLPASKESARTTP